MTLNMVKSGRRVTVESIALASELRGRLFSLGILPGVTLCVIDPSLHGASLVSCRGNRLALGNDLSNAIHIRDAG